MDHPFTEQCFYSNCLSCQTNITIINLHTFVSDKVRVRELCCPLISRKLMIKSHACVVQENTHTQEGFTGLTPSHPLPSGNSRLGALNWPLLWRSSWVKHVKEFLFGIQTPWRWFSKTELYLFFPTQTLSLLLLIYFDFYMQFTTWGSCSSWWPYFVWESCFSCTLFQNGGKLFFHPMITGPKSILSI